MNSFLNSQVQFKPKFLSHCVLVLTEVSSKRKTFSVQSLLEIKVNLLEN